MTGDIGFPFQPPPSEPFPKEEPSPKPARKKVRARRQGEGSVVKKSSDQPRTESLARKVGQPTPSPSMRKRKFSERAEPSSPLVQESMQAEPVPKRRFIEVITSGIASRTGDIKRMAVRGVAETVATYLGGPGGLAAMKGVELLYDLHQHNFTAMEGNARTLVTAALHSQEGAQVAVAAEVALFINDWRRSHSSSLVNAALSMIMGNPIMNAAGAGNHWQEAYDRIMGNRSVQDALLYLFSASSDAARSFVEVFSSHPQELQALTTALTQRAQEL